MATVDPTTNLDFLDEVFDFLLSQPTAQEVIEHQISEGLQEYVRYLLDANRNGKLTATEHFHMEEISQINHLMVLLKAHARKRLEAK